MWIPSGTRLRPTALAAVLAIAAAAGWQAPAAAQPVGATAVHGQAQLQQQGATLVVTTRNGAGTRHSAIDWRSFSVPAGTTTRFDQPTANSTSINRVTGNAPSQILGTLRSNGHLVLVNPSGIAVGAGALVDTAGFTASTLRLSNADLAAGRMRFNAGGAAGALTVDGRVLARNGDVVMLGSDVRVGESAVLQAPAGAVLLAAGQKIELTGRGLEGIRLEVVGSADRVVNLGQLQGDAVGIFAAQLKHSGLVRAARVVRMQDRLHLMSALSERKDGDKDKGGNDQDDDRGNRNGKHGDEDGAGDRASNGDGNANGKGNGAGPVANNGKGKGSDKAAVEDDTHANPSGNTNIVVNDPGPVAAASPSGGTGSPAPSDASAPPAQAAGAADAPAPAVETALQAVAAFTDFRAPAITPAQLLDVSRQQQRYATVATTWRARDEQQQGGEPDTRTLGGPALQCTR